MKKLLIAFVLACLMLNPLQIFADDAKHTTLTFEVDQSYEWSAPATITFASNASTDTKTGSVTVSQNVLASGKKLVIKISSSEDFLMNNGSGATRSYVVKKGSTAVAAGGTVLEVAAGTNTGSQLLNFELQSVAVPIAGSYTGQCDFEASIASA